jgi:DNA-binding NarL/FixJ family response regulator
MKIFIVEDHKIVRDGLKLIMESEATFKVVGEADNVTTTLSELEKDIPDVCLLDINLHNESGMTLIEPILKRFPQTKVVVLSMHTSPEYIVRCFKSGVSAYFPKDISPKILIEGIKTLNTQDKFYLDGQKELLATTSADIKLTDRETEIIRLIAKGLSSKQIADVLKVSPRTVESHRFNIFKKLDVTNSFEAVTKATEIGIFI